MGLFPGSARELPNASPIDVALVNPQGDQLAGFDSSRPANAVITGPTVTNVSSVIAAANAARRQLILFNDGGNIAYVAFAGTASLTAFTLRIPANGSYETPLDSYTGDVSAIRASGSGVIRVTEITT
jgi:hypothetical protein